MFIVNNNDWSIFLTRGDIAFIELNGKLAETDDYEFKSGDVVRFRVMEKGKCDVIVLSKDVEVTKPSLSVTIALSSEDTRIGEPINKPKDYWYEVELNPDTRPQTMIGYDTAGPKIFRLYPEGVD